MKKLVTTALVAILVVSCLFALVACDNEPLADPKYSYTITGNFNGWKVNVDAEDETKLDATYAMEAVALSDKRVASIKDVLKEGGVQYLYIVEHTFTNNKVDGEWESGWSVSYALTEGAELTEVDGNMAIKVIKTEYVVNEAAGIAEWSQAWLPSPEMSTVVSLTPDTLYCPPHSKTESWTDSGDWNDNPIVLTAGTYYVVIASFTDGTYGLGAIAK